MGATIQREIGSTTYNSLDESFNSKIVSCFLFLFSMQLKVTGKTRK